MTQDASEYSGTITTQVDSSVATLYFDQQTRRNAMTSRMWALVPSALHELSENPEVRVIVIRGAGEEAFVSGADISEFQRARTSETARDYERVNELAFEAVRNCPKPTIALIHGFCIGGGVGLAAGADLRIAAEDALFSVPAARLGLGYPPRSLATLLALVGPARVKELFFTARRVTAQEALAMGLVNEVTAKPALDARVASIAATIASNAPLTLAAIKLCLKELAAPEPERDDAAIAQAVQRCFESSDYQEGVRAFLEKRKPRFSGR